LKSIKLIHIGDVHYPEAADKGTQVDKKDKGFDPEFVDKIAPNPFMEVGRSLIKCLEEDEIQGILFSGDLTSIGNLVAYDDCVKYFDQIIRSVEKNTNRKLEVHVVPGNHDLKRKGINIKERFEDFSAVWSGIGRDIFPIDNIKKSTIGHNGVELKIISLNTCLGCGEEYKKFPDEIANVYKKLIDASELENKENFDNFCERIDTPAIYQKNLHEIENEVSESEESSLCLILGHHALLPQPTVRLALYTEIINGGNARMVLTTLNNPVIYCHGHIHDDPIEIVTQASRENSSLVLISAPEYIKGFNVVEIFYTNSGYPVGLVVAPYRTETWGGVRLKEITKIPIRQPENMLNFCDERTVSVYKCLTDRHMRFEDIKSALQEQGADADDHELENMLDELEWLRVVSISNKSKPSRNWLIGRIGL